MERYIRGKGKVCDVKEEEEKAPGKKKDCTSQGHS